MINLSSLEFLNDSDALSYEEDSNDSIVGSSSGSEQSSDEEDGNSNDVSANVVDSNKSWIPVTTSSDLIFPSLCPNDEVPIIPPNTITPLDFYKLFVTDEIIENIVLETNRYANSQKENPDVKISSKLKQWQPTTFEEMNRFFAILLCMEVVSKTDPLDYLWSTTAVWHDNFIPSVMPLERFEIILKCWHFTDTSLDPSGDRLFKVRPLMEGILKRFQTIMTPGKTLVIDELVMPVKNPQNRAVKYGLTLYKLCTASGYILNFTVCKGAPPPGKRQAERIVESLMKDYYGQGHNLYCGFMYTTYNLAKKLINEKTRLCGKVRRKFSKGLPADILKEKLSSGQIIGKQKGCIKCIKWCDECTGLMITSFEEHDTTLQESGRIRKGQPVMRPKCAIDYKSITKGIDHGDEINVEVESATRKDMKWYQNIAEELLFGTATMNAWILYNMTFPTKRIKYLKFLEHVTRSLVARKPLTELGPTAKEENAAMNSNGKQIT